MFSRSCAMHTVARNACKIEYTNYVISKHMCMNIKFYQAGRPMNAPTDWIVQTIAMLRSGGYVSHIANNLHEPGTAACRYKQ